MKDARASSHDILYDLAIAISQYRCHNIDVIKKVGVTICYKYSEVFAREDHIEKTMAQHHNDSRMALA